MNKTNIKTWQEGDEVVKEWADRALDDDDRYAEDAVILVARGKDEKSAQTEMVILYDQWIRDTR